MIPWHDLQEVADKAPEQSVWRHKKGGIYTVTGYVMIESTWRIGIVYHGDHGLGIVRDAEEFLDGRFARMKAGE